MIVGIDVHQDSHTAGLLDPTGREIATLRFANSHKGVERLRDWLAGHDAAGALVGIENAAGYGRLLCGELTATGHEVLNVPAWRVHRDRPTHGAGKSDPADAIAIAHVVLRKREKLGSAVEPEIVRAVALLEVARRQAVAARTEQIQRLRAIWTQTDPEAEIAVAACTSQRALKRLKRIAFGEGLAERTAAGLVRELARDIEHLNQRIAELEAQLADLLYDRGNPVEDLCGAGPAFAAALIAHAGDVRRFRDKAAFARFCGVAPVPCGSGRTADRHRLDRGGNRQLNAALHRIALVQARHEPRAQAFLARKHAEGKTKREARRALKRHLANVVYRRLLDWAENLATSEPHLT